MSPNFRPALAALVLALAVATPRVAAACAVCLGGTGGGTSRAFAIGSVFLSVMPLAALGVAVWYIRRRTREIERTANARRAFGPAAGSVISRG